MPETRTVKGFAEVGLPLAEGDFESAPLWPFRYRSAFHSFCGGFGRKAYLL